MRITEPSELVDEFKKSGEFDRLRHGLLSQFQNGDALPHLLSQVQDIVKRQLVSDQSLQYMSEALAGRELMQEVERNSVVERALTDVSALHDFDFGSILEEEISDLLLENRHPGTSKKAITAGSAGRYLNYLSQRSQRDETSFMEDDENPQAENSESMDISMEFPEEGSQAASVRSHDEGFGSEQKLGTDIPQSERSPRLPDASVDAPRPARKVTEPSGGLAIVEENSNND